MWAIYSPWACCFKISIFTALIWGLYIYIFSSCKRKILQNEIEKTLRSVAAGLASCQRLYTEPERCFNTSCTVRFGSPYERYCSLCERCSSFCERDDSFCELNGRFCAQFGLLHARYALLKIAADYFWYIFFFVFILWHPLSIQTNSEGKFKFHNKYET